MADSSDTDSDISEELPKYPNRPLSSFFAWSQENRERVKNENPNARGAEIAMLLGTQWRALSEDEQKLWKEEAAANMEKWKQSMADLGLLRSKPVEVFSDASSDISEEPPKYPKRPLTSFFAWSEENRERVKSENPDSNGREVSALLGAEWKALSEDEQKPWKEEAAAKFEEWKQQMADLGLASSKPRKKKN